MTQCQRFERRKSYPLQTGPVKRIRIRRVPVPQRNTRPRAEAVEEYVFSVVQTDPLHCSTMAVFVLDPAPVQATLISNVVELTLPMSQFFPFKGSTLNRSE